MWRVTSIAHPVRSMAVRRSPRNALTRCFSPSQFTRIRPSSLRGAEVVGSNPAVPTQKSAGQRLYPRADDQQPSRIQILESFGMLVWVSNGVRSACLYYLDDYVAQ
jgi:hypothetical protein